MASSYYYYLRRKAHSGGHGWVMGIVDENGAATSSEASLDIYYYKKPTDISQIPSEYHMTIVKGVVGEILDMIGGMEQKALIYQQKYKLDVRHMRGLIATRSDNIIMNPLDVSY